ncbi:ribonuclease domain-containing protein [Sebaldella sp. S0638]|uniref:ribonuclease domain-containing protein n=1 Tax=Sebaldella sp. S0638 TaxID=2957809 RepID=UPI00209EDD31|nr:ribonuclease domain-containing protein [Sebaldella sp. S0638]MCP1224845.1 hypothetical protein [Sebaldella sp. S0638]
MKKLILAISALLLLFIGCFYFWDLRNDVSEIKAAVTEQSENAGTEKNNIKETQKNETTAAVENTKKENETVKDTKRNNKQENNSGSAIDTLTEEKKVTDYLKENGKLPDYYITKKEAQRDGWVAKEGNLCEVLPGRAIGGDIFTNREKTLPVKKGRVWYEADINYECGRRNARRVVFSNDGLIFVTHDHYKNFEEVK